MKSLIFVLFLVAFSSSTYGLISILNDQNLEIAENEVGPSLSSDLNTEEMWESYNYWQCFPVESVTFDCIEYDDKVFVPGIRVEIDSKILLFDTPLEENLKCDPTFHEWKIILDSGGELCFYASQMLDLSLDNDDLAENPTELWYISQLKGSGEYWYPGINK